MNQWTKYTTAMTAVLLLLCGGAIADAYPIPPSGDWDYTNGDVSSTTLGTAGDVGDHNINVFNAYSGWGGTGLNVGGSVQYVDLLLVDGSVASSTNIYVGGSNTASGNCTLVIDNSTLNATGTANSNMRIGNSSSNNSLYVQNGGALNVTGAGFNTINNNEVSNNAVVINGTGSVLNSAAGDFILVYGNSTGSLSVEAGGQLTVGTAVAGQDFRIRYGHDTTVAVTGDGSKVDVYAYMTLGESGTYCSNNTLALEDSGSLWIHNVNGSSTPFRASGEGHQIDLGGGFMLIKGNQENNANVTDIVYADNGSGYAAGVKGTATWTGSEWEFTSSGDPGNYYAFYVDGTAGESFLVDGVDAAGYTVFMNVVPEPATMSVLALGGLLAVRRRRRK